MTWMYSARPSSRQEPSATSETRNLLRHGGVFDASSGLDEYDTLRTLLRAALRALPCNQVMCAPCDAARRSPRGGTNALGAALRRSWRHPRCRQLHVLGDRRRHRAHVELLAGDALHAQMSGLRLALGLEALVVDVELALLVRGLVDLGEQAPRLVRGLHEVEAAGDQREQEEDVQPRHWCP